MQQCFGTLASAAGGVQAGREILLPRSLAAMVLRKLGRETEAARLLQETADLDPTDFWARYLIGSSLPSDNRLLLDLALDCARAGFYAEAITILKAADRQVNDGSVPTISYALGYVHQ